MNSIETPPAEIRLLLPWYVNGTLDAGERQAVELHIERCDDCREAVAELRKVAAAFASDQPTPLVPEPPATAFIDLATNRAEPRRSQRQLPWLVAASIAGLLAISYVVTSVIPGSNEFRTVTDPSRTAEIAYLFDVAIEPDAQAIVQAAVSDAFAGSVVVASGDGLRVTMSMPSATMKELDSYADTIRQLDGVLRVDIVGVQLPIE